MGKTPSAVTDKTHIRTEKSEMNFKDFYRITVTLCLFSTSPALNTSKYDPDDSLSFVKGTE